MFSTNNKYKKVHFIVDVSKEEKIKYTSCHIPWLKGKRYAIS